MRGEFNKFYYKGSIVKKSQNDSRRHQSRCQYYQDGYCIKLLHKCCGSSKCDYYKEIKIITKNYILTGSFTVKYLESNKIFKGTIGRNISKDSDLVNEVFNHSVGSKFKADFDEILLLKKDIFVIYLD